MLIFVVDNNILDNICISVPLSDIDTHTSFARVYYYAIRTSYQCVFSYLGDSQLTLVVYSSVPASNTTTVHHHILKAKKSLPLSLLDSKTIGIKNKQVRKWSL